MEVQCRKKSHEERVFAAKCTPGPSPPPPYALYKVIRLYNVTYITYKMSGLALNILRAPLLCT